MGAAQSVEQSALHARLKPMHRWMLKLVMRHGQKTVIAVGTAISCLFSLLIVLISCYIIFGSDFFAPSERYLYVLAVIVPLIVTPAMFGFTVSTLSALGTLGAEYEELAHRHREMAEKDMLTGLLNTRGLLARNERFASGTTVALVDIDDFKTINDSHGHHGGDLALVALARVLVDLVGPGGTVARTGGDEFVLVLEPGSPVALPVRVEARATPTIAVKATIGVYVCPDDRSPSVALREADLRMYEGKRAPRTDLVR